MDMPIVRLRMLDTGFCRVPAPQVLRGAPRGHMDCHALVGLIRHPTRGVLLWDAGYAPRINAALRPWPFPIYRLLTPLHLDPQLDLVRQLADLGIEPAAVGHMIISHFHMDHISALRDFPQATIVADAEAIASVRGLKGIAALRKAFVPSLLPDDFAARVQPIYNYTGPQIAPFGAGHDLFGDGSLLLVRLPGHASGQIGLLLNTAAGRFLLAADGAWLNRSIREQRGPGRAGYMIAADRHKLDATLAKLHQFAEANPTVTIVPTHCPESYALVQHGDY